MCAEDSDVVRTLIAPVEELTRGIEMETAGIIPVCPDFPFERQLAMRANREYPDAVVQPIARVNKLPISGNQNLGTEIAASKAGRQIHLAGQYVTERRTERPDMGDEWPGRFTRLRLQ